VGAENLDFRRRRSEKVPKVGIKAKQIRQKDPMIVFMPIEFRF
jgi:hypothetical protein